MSMKTNNQAMFQCVNTIGVIADFAVRYREGKSMCGCHSYEPYFRRDGVRSVHLQLGSPKPVTFFAELHR